MYDDLRNFFVECVLADHDAYEEARSLKEAGLSIDLRLAVHACTSMFHMADHVFKESPSSVVPFAFTSLGDYQKHLIGICPGFQVVRDCANAHKHRVLTRGRPLISSVAALQELAVITQYEDSDGPYSIAEKEVRATLNDGSVAKLHEALRSVRDMWWGELLRLGVIAQIPPAAPAKPFPPAREQPGPSAYLGFRLRKGERFSQTLVLQKFNYTTMQAELVDLTGYTAGMRMYEAPKSNEP